MRTTRLARRDQATFETMVSRKHFRRFHNYLLGRTSETMGPILRGVVHVVAPGFPKAPDSWRRGLIIGQARIGDVLFRTCSLEQLKRGLPECDWYYLASEDSAEVLRGNPFLTEVLPILDSSGSVCLLPGALAKLREIRFDVAVCTDFESYWRDHKIALQAGIANRVGFIYRGLSGLVTLPVACPYPSPWAAYFRAMVSHITGSPPEWPLVPRIYATEEDELLASAQWNKMRLSADKPVVACFITTRGSARVLPHEHCAEALSLVYRMCGASIVVAGAKKDAPLLRRFVSKCNAPCSLLDGGLGLRALYCFLKRCSAALCPDSGPRHIANAAKIPVVFIRNLYCSRIETGKYCENEVDISPDAEFVRLCKQEAVLRRVTPNAVAETILRLLRGR